MPAARPIRAPVSATVNCCLEISIIDCSVCVYVCVCVSVCACFFVTLDKRALTLSAVKYRRLLFTGSK